MKEKRDEPQFPLDKPEKINICLNCTRNDCDGACDKIGLTKSQKAKRQVTCKTLEVRQLLLSPLMPFKAR